ncbi:MAG: carbon monoxide dehydrogenase, partial [Lachnospiraceae bacterium]|nr:carbon monoxide dehydrogenase [Lachnospiraceae bacterium]
WGIEISEIPLVGCAPEWMSEKAVSIGNYVVATGIDTFLGVDPYTKGSDQVRGFLQSGIKDWVGANFIVNNDIDMLTTMMIEHIEEKREALGI